MNVVTCPHWKARIWPEERVKGTAENPIFSMCCCKGEVSLPKLPRSCLLPTTTTTPEYIYGYFDNEANRQHSHLIDRAILAPRNKGVNALNEYAVASFHGEEFVYFSADRVADET